MDLGKWLRDRKKSVVNQWQNSTVLDAVSANTKADQARRVQAGQPQQFQGNAVARGITNLVGANKMKDTSVQDAADDEAFRNDLKNIINLRTSGQITPGQAQAKAINAAPTGNTDYTKDVLNNQANRSGVGQAVLPALGTFSKPFATGLSDIGTAVGTGVEAFTPFNGVGKNIADASKRQSQGIEDLYRASSFNGGQEGENRLVTGVSSGLGSLASSLATGATGGLKSGVGMKLSTGGRQLLRPTTMSGLQFGLSASAGQMRDATANGKSAGQAFGTGLVAGGVEAGLEKVGLDKYLGAKGNFLRRTGSRMLTEGLQEGSQSLAQSLVSGTFKHVNPVDALKQAALEGGMGGLVGGIGGVGGDISLNLQQKQTQAPQEVKQQVVQSKPVLQQTGIPARPGSIRERIQLAKDSVANKIAGNSLINNQVGAIPNPAYRAPFTQGEPGAELLNIQNPLGAKQGIPITNELGATIRKPVKTNTGSTLVEPSTPNQPKLKITDANNQSTYIDPAKLRGVARQSYESKRGQVNNQDTNYDPKVSIRMQKDYIEGRTPVKGDATTGEGAQLPGKGMTPKQRQSFIDKVKNSKLMQDDGGSINNKTTAQERIDAKVGTSRFSERAKTSEEISPELQKQIKPTEYTKQVNEKQVETSSKLVNKGYKKAAIDVSARLDARESGSDAQTVSDTIAVIKKLDEKGNPSNHQQASELFDKLSKRLTEAGQTVQAASLLYNRTPQGLYYSAQRTLKKAGVELTPKLDGELKTLLKDVKATDANTEEGGLARFKFIEKVNKSVPSGRADKTVQLWKAGLLSGPITQVGNITANTFEQSTKRLYEDPVATGVDILMSAFTGKRSKSLTGKGVLSGAGEGAQKGISYFKTGYDPRNPAQKFDVRNVHYSDSPLGKAAEAYTQTIFKSMGTADQPFYYASMRNSLYDQAITEAKNQGLRGMKRAAFVKQYTTEPSKKALQLADTEARYDVFQNKTKLGEAASGLKGKTGAVGDFVIPFSGVPSSIATRIVERTPIGTATEVVRQMNSGNFDQRRMAQAIARGTTGIVLVGIGKALAEGGLMTLGFPQDDDERKLWQVEGKQAFSIKIGGKWRSLNYFQPAGTLIAAGAAYQQAKKEGKSETDAWGTAVATTGKALTEQSFLKGVSGTINAVTDPKRSAETFLNNTAGSLVPNWLRAPVRAADGTQREINSPLDSLKAGIPGQRQTLLAKNNPYGEDLKRSTSGWNALLNPTRPSDVKETDNTSKELRRLQDSGNGIMTPSVKKDFLGKEAEKLTDKQINEIERQINPAIKTAWDKIIPNEEYKKLSDEDKMKTLRRVKEDLVAIGKKQYAADNQVGEYAQDYKGKESKLTASQKALIKGGDLGKYIKSSDEKDAPVTYKEKYEAALADYNDKDNGYSEIDKIKKGKELNKLKVQKDYSDDVNDLYSMSKEDIYSYVTNSKDGKKLADDLLKLDQALLASGSTKYLKFKNGIAPSTAKGKKGSKSAKSQSQSEVNNLTQDTLSKLNSLLTGVNKPVKGVKKVAVAKPSLKKITVKK